MTNPDFVLNPEDFYDSRARSLFESAGLSPFELCERYSRAMKVLENPELVPGIDPKGVLNPYTEMIKDFQAAAIVVFELTKREVVIAPAIGDSICGVQRMPDLPYEDFGRKFVGAANNLIESQRKFLEHVIDQVQ